jgi:hypothetical protein
MRETRVPKAKSSAIRSGVRHIVDQNCPCRLVERQSANTVEPLGPQAARVSGEAPTTLPELPQSLPEFCEVGVGGLFGRMDQSMRLILIPPLCLPFSLPLATATATALLTLDAMSHHGALGCPAAVQIVPDRRGGPAAWPLVETANH